MFDGPGWRDTQPIFSAKTPDSSSCRAVFRTWYYSIKRWFTATPGLLLRVAILERLARHVFLRRSVDDFRLRLLSRTLS